MRSLTMKVVFLAVTLAVLGIALHRRLDVLEAAATGLHEVRTGAERRQVFRD
jgi:hypothetical protein